MKNLLVVLLMLIAGFSFVSCSQTENKTYVEQSFIFNDTTKVGDLVIGVPTNQSLDDLICNALKQKGYSFVNLSNFIQSEDCQVVCYVEKSPKEYALKVKGKKICQWRHVNILKKTPTGYLSKNIEFISY